MFSQVTLGQYTIPEKPSLQTSVYDYSNLLSEIEKEESVKSELSSIYGIGPVKASYYYDKYKITKLDEFENKIKKGTASIL